MIDAGSASMRISAGEAAAARRDPRDVVGASTQRGSQYAALSRSIRQMGLLDRRIGYYLSKIAVTVTLWVAGWTGFVMAGDSWWQLVVAAFLAVVFAQIGFLAHDAGHRQIFTSRRSNDIVGILLADLAIGLGYRFWVDTHNRHHAHPNQEGRDPDVDIGVLAFTARQANARTGLTRLLYHYQAYLFFPMLLLTAFALHLDSARSLAGGAARGRVWERVLFAVHVVGYLAAVFWVLSPGKALVFMLVHQGLLGLYLGCSFAPNHKPGSTDDLGVSWSGGT